MLQSPTTRESPASKHDWPLLGNSKPPPSTSNDDHFQMDENFLKSAEVDVMTINDLSVSWQSKILQLIESVKKSRGIYQRIQILLQWHESRFCALFQLQSVRESCFLLYVFPANSTVIGTRYLIFLYPTSRRDRHLLEFQQLILPTRAESLTQSGWGKSVLRRTLTTRACSGVSGYQGKDYLRNEVSNCPPVQLLASFLGGMDFLIVPQCSC